MLPGGCSKKRITVHYRSEIQLVLVPDSWDELLKYLCDTFGIKCDVVLCTKHRAVVSSLDLIRDNDELYVSKVSSTQADSWLTLNVGGHKLLTTWNTLTKEKDTMLAKMFDKDSIWDNKTDNEGAYLVDRSPQYFLPLLEYLRHGELVIDPNINPEGVLLEAKFFGFTNLIPKIEDYIQKLRTKTLEPLSREEVIKSIISTPSNTVLRFMGLNLSGSDLRGLDLKNINFCNSVLVGANLSKCDLYGAIFNKANMKNVIFDDAYCAGIKMENTILDGASMIGCNFEDPNLKPSSLVGAQMKDVNLENANLSGVNLRVVNLKGSRLKNTSLKGACLAGADLQGCDLTGADLENTNLRGANLTDVNFGEITSALHMTQLQTRHR